MNRRKRIYHETFETLKDAYEYMQKVKDIKPLERRTHMRYIINLTKEIGTNTFDTIVLESTDNKKEYDEHLERIAGAFDKCGFDVGITIYPKGDFEQAYIKIKALIK